MKKLLCVIMIAMLVLSQANLGFTIDNDSIVADDEELKVYCKANLEQDFADNHVLVVLSNEASLKFRTYTPSDFPEVTCSEIKELTAGVSTMVQRKVAVQSGELQYSSSDSTVSSMDPKTFNQILCLKLSTSSKKMVLETIKLLEMREDILYVGPDYYTYGYSTTPNDPKLNLQWGIPKISLPLAWDISTGYSGVSVGVMDTGIDYSHGDLANRVDLSRSWDYINDQPYQNPAVNSGIHGTAVAGIIGAQGNNANGVSGVCWDVTLISLRIFYEEDGLAQGLHSQLIQAIQDAETKNIDILNYSGGSTGLPDDNITPIYQAVQNYSGLLVCAAGNENSDNDEVYVYPAYLPFSNVMSVGASTRADQKESDSNYGDYSVDLFAPGDEIYSAYPSNLYHTYIGTSFAAPFVTGVAALMLSIHPELTPAQIRQVIIDSVDEIAALEYLCLSGGRLNAYKALCDDSIHSYTGNASGHSCSGTRCDYWEPHTYAATRYNASQHKLYCSQCSYTTYANHTYRAGSTVCTACGYNSSGSIIMRTDDAACCMA